MKDIIERLKALNKIDVQLQTLKKDMERLPKQLSEQQQVSKTLRASIDRSKEQITKLKVEADGIELEVKSGEEALKRLATQMNVLRTSKEFETVRRQMDAQRAWNKENEGKVLELLEKVDEFQKDVDKNSEALAAAEKKLAEETAKVEKEVAELKTQFDTLSTERNGLATDVPEKELTVYNRIAATRGQAIATVDRGICSACFMKIPPQVHNLALLAREMVCCPSCGRILTAS
ncbi:MAG TPA: C4-type zinc ribbon domain-containing protein [Planctomycetota bacterium]|nr:C4-type zinc ribbon domain-containing protein [Planctomycetota bacterium]